MSGRGLRVELLGPLRAWTDPGERSEVALGPARRRAVFAVLAARANQEVTRQDLVDAVWGDEPPPTAVGALHTYVSGLRAALGQDRAALASGRASYSLRVPDDGVDAAGFERSRLIGTRLLGAGDWSGARTALTGALALWRGPALSGVPGPFAEVERRRLAELRLGALEAHARAGLELGEHTEVLASLSALVAEHPGHESLRELVMLALLRSGRRAEALESYRDARRALAAQGVEPGPALRALHQRILHEDPGAAAVAEVLAAGPVRADRITRVRDLVAGPAGWDRAFSEQHPTVVRAPAARRTPDHPTPARSSTPAPPRPTARPQPARPRPASHFLGRTEELALLHELITDVRAGRGGLLWLEGDAGVGKSALLAEALSTAPGCRVVPVSGARGLFGDLATAPLVAAALTGSTSPEPLVLLVDDLHALSEPDLLMWHRLATTALAPRGAPLLLLAASRPLATGRVLPRLRRAVRVRGGHLLTLPPLPTAYVAALVGHVVGARPGASLLDLARRAGGNPLFAERVAASLVRRDAVRVVDGVAEVDEVELERVPTSLLSVAAGVLEPLSAAAREVLRCAAVLGPRFRVAELGAVTGRTVRELLGALDEAVAASVVVDPGSGEELAFRNACLHRALLDGLPTTALSALRRRAARALSTLGAPPERIAAVSG
ncbi:transcriptional regulator, SARP family [Actinosynnema mirum DSM 43827]|uniref:Transcriptional regulator, SARP family n=1 Tax=Actinosynnema mirum (strain ATCC 29888 / DSM 43827 / JCM 3225 / NBRC 14064 / NCIMB 13271 / NRRL B-12336 / IMRU 3971 / 101) TaxID=446462 RepID=C6WQJ2_ACTMD|nr:transcriptional regulator, SARP family [Actinosynnema mirum DSM 43827]